MAQSSPPPRKSEPLGKRSYTLRLTFSSLITAGIVLFIGFGWTFVMGVMVGRGYNPENKMPQLAQFMPADEHAAQVGREKLEDSLPKAQVMKPEELRYATTLRGKTGQNATVPAPRSMQNATAPLASTAPVTASPAGAGTGAGAVTQPGATPAATPAPQQTPAPPAQPKPAAEPLFDYVFQVATFKDADSVDRLRARLEGAGLRSRMDKDGKLLKVMVLLRGNQEAGQNVRQQMTDMGLGQPLQRAKTPVRQKR